MPPVPTSATFPDVPFALVVTFKFPSPELKASATEESSTRTRPAPLHPGTNVSAAVDPDLTSETETMALHGSEEVPKEAMLSKLKVQMKPS